MATMKLASMPHLYQRKTSLTSIFTPEDFPLVKPLGEGSYSSVYLAKKKGLVRSDSEKPEDFVVVKKVVKAKSQQDFMVAEKEASKRLHHPNIVDVRTSFEDKDFFYFVMSYLQGVDMFRYLDSTAFAAMDETRTKRLFKQLVEALIYAAKRGVSHRDLKLENLIFLNAGTESEKLVIIDWGLAAVDNEFKQSERWVGSPDYVAPEVLLHRAYQPEKADVWSLGVLLFIFLTGKLPYNKKTRFAMLRNGQHPSVVFPAEALKRLSGDARDIIEKCLTFDTAERHDLNGLLNHPWLNC